jgi:hypothetical protein
MLLPLLLDDFDDELDEGNSAECIFFQREMKAKG